MMNLSMQTSFNKPLICICGNRQGDHFIKDGYELTKCSQCNLVRTSYVYADANKFFEEVPALDSLEYWGFPEYFERHKNVFDYYFEERFNRIKNSIKLAENDLWMDIGSGYGFWQKFLSVKKIKNYGIEIDPKAYAYSKKQGIEIDLLSIENFESHPKKFKVITMCDVLEHVEDPLMVLRKCHDLLTDDGVMYIQIPDVLGMKIPFGHSLGLPHHLWQFNHSAMKEVFLKTDFKILHHWTGVQGVIKFYESGGPSFLRKFYWQLAATTKRGNRLQYLVKKS